MDVRVLALPHNHLVNESAVTIPQVFLGLDHWLPLD